MAKLLNILYHGNCIDGWFSAYIIYSALKDKYEDVHFMPISPNQPRTWPKLHDILQRDIILTDVMVDKEALEDWSAVANSVFCIDHHETTKDTMCSMSNALHDTSCCATMLAWKKYYPEKEVPKWVEQINRIDMWTDITDDDRAMREILNPLAHQCDCYLIQTEFLIENFDNEEHHKSIMRIGHEQLREKDEGLKLLFRAKNGRVMKLTEEKCEQWGLSTEWVGKKGYIIDTTNVVIDSTEAGYVALQENPEADFFCNYRRKEFIRKDTQKKEVAYVYSVRAQPGMDVTIDGVFAGHKTSAGANIVKGTRKLPFVM